MDSCYERLIELLGKSPDDPRFDQFVQDIDETPQLLIDRKNVRQYSFRENGIFIRIDKLQNQIKSVSLHLLSAMVESGASNRYSGNLPAGITPNDKRSLVTKKLALQPRSLNMQGRTPSDPKDNWDYYTVGPLELLFMFNGRSKKLHALSILYTIDNVPLEPPPEPETFLQSHCTAGVFKTIVLAQEESRRLKHNFVGSDQLFLGLLANTQSLPAIALISYGVNLDKARVEVERIIGFGHSCVGREIPYTPGAKHVFASALKEADSLDSNVVDNEHLLLGMIEFDTGLAIRVLENLGVNPAKLRLEILRLIKEKNES